MSRSGAAPRAAVPVPGARQARRNPSEQCPRRGQSQERRQVARAEEPEGKARSAQNALKHGMRAQKYVLLPQEDAAAFAALETAIVAELAPEGVLQTLLARRVAVAAWRLERADRMEAEVLEFRSYEDANAGLALIRDGNATRSFDTLMRYRNAAMAEFWRRSRRSRRSRPSRRPAPWRCREQTCALASRRRATERTQEGCGAPARLCACPIHRSRSVRYTSAAAPWLPDQPEPAPRSGGRQRRGAERTRSAPASERAEQQLHTCAAPNAARCGPAR